MALTDTQGGGSSAASLAATVLDEEAAREEAQKVSREQVIFPDDLLPGVNSEPVSFTDAREQVVYEMAVALANGRLVSQGLYDRAVKTLGHESITDVIVLMGYYTCVSLTMNFYAVPAGSPGLAR